MKHRSTQRRQAPTGSPPGGPVFVSPEDQKRMSLDRRARSRRHWQTHRIPRTASSSSGYQTGNRTHAASEGRGEPGSSRSCRERLRRRAYRAWGGEHSSDLKPCRQQGQERLSHRLNQPREGSGAHPGSMVRRCLQHQKRHEP